MDNRRPSDLTVHCVEDTIMRRSDNRVPCPPPPKSPPPREPPVLVESDEARMLRIFTASLADYMREEGLA